ncbi:MAG TPA: radical SAM protein [Elusimicrobia bacterium]|nr:radical SAM protein [Elusimicrobiota bacterium]
MSPTAPAKIQALLQDAVRSPELYGPTHLTILPTYRCTAACEQCCFESSPQISGRLPLDNILEYIDEAASSFPSLKLVVFSGGECFLLRDDLDAAISRVTERGLMSRCVTNGYWATSARAAADRVAALKQAGLTEINFSTGDNHQRFVPFDRVALGAVATAAAGIRTIIAVEGYRESAFSVEAALEHPTIKEFRDARPARGGLSFFSNVWIPFRSDSAVSQDPSLASGGDASAEGCDNVLENVVITPHQRVSSCCGLTFEHIPEMKLGPAGVVSLKDIYYSQFDDFIKLWLRVEGPERILQFAASKNPRVVYPQDLSHPCQSCAELFRNQEVRKTLRDCYPEKIHDVIFRYKMIINLRGRAQPPSALSNGKSRRVGYGA